MTFDREHQGEVRTRKKKYKKCARCGDNYEPVEANTTICPECKRQLQQIETARQGK